MRASSRRGAEDLRARAVHGGRPRLHRRLRQQRHRIGAPVHAAVRGGRLHGARRAVPVPGVPGHGCRHQHGRPQPGPGRRELDLAGKLHVLFTSIIHTSHATSLYLRGQSVRIARLLNNRFCIQVDTGTNFLDLPPTVAANAANRLNGPFQRLTGIRGFFDRGDQCTFPKRTTPAQLNAALPTLDFTFPSVKKGYTLTASFSASTFLTTVTHSNGTYQYCSISASNAADNGGVNVMPNNLMVRRLPGPKSRLSCISVRP